MIESSQNSIRTKAWVHWLRWGPLFEVPLLFIWDGSWRPWLLYFRHILPLFTSTSNFCRKNSRLTVWLIFSLWRAFINGVFELSVYFKDDPPVVNALDENNKILKKLLQYESMLVDQMNRAVSRNLNNFLKRDINKVKETKRHFDKISEDYDNLLVRNSTCLKSKTASESEELSNLLKATRSLFQHTALDYVCQMSCLQSKKRYEVLDSVSMIFIRPWSLFSDDILSNINFESSFCSWCKPTELTSIKDLTYWMTLMWKAYWARFKRCEKILKPSIENSNTIIL